LRAYSTTLSNSPPCQIIRIDCGSDNDADDGTAFWDDMAHIESEAQDVPSVHLTESPGNDTSLDSWPTDDNSRIRVSLVSGVKPTYGL
jgi:hypothetical protein